MDIFVSVPAQTLELFDGADLLCRYSVSTATAGAGEQRGSYRTPRGRHVVRAKIGAGMPENTVFVGRRPTGEVWTPELALQHPARDWMLTRIMWLSGREPGFNRLGMVDTMRRYIYLHGSPDAVSMGTPGSIGCVRMRNSDIVDLFDRVPVYTAANIGDYSIVEGDWSSLEKNARALREQVFVREQGVPPHLEYDHLDLGARHVLALSGSGEAVGYGRLLMNGPAIIVGRMAVTATWRGKGVGSAMLRRLVELARSNGASEISLAAQRHAIPFYARFGFAPEGEEFLEAGIVHLRMRRFA